MENMTDKRAELLQMEEESRALEERDAQAVAIAREKQLKRCVRSKKNWLVETKNPNWDDWGEDICGMTSNTLFSPNTERSPS